MEITLRNQIMPNKKSIQLLEMTLAEDWTEKNILKEKEQMQRDQPLSTIIVVGGKKWGEDWRTLKKILQCNMWSKMDYGCQL